MPPRSLYMSNEEALKRHCDWESCRAKPGHICQGQDRGLPNSHKTRKRIDYSTKACRCDDGFKEYEGKVWGLRAGEALLTCTGCKQHFLLKGETRDDVIA